MEVLMTKQKNGFKKGQNPNHPEKGSKIKVEPIRKLKDIKSIKKQLNDNPRNYCLFAMGVNTALRAGDLVNIKVGDVRHLKAGDTLELKEQKTKKNRQVTLNKTVVDAIQCLIKDEKLKDNESLFKGQRGNQALTVPSVHRLVKSWCKSINLKGNYGSHTLRKTFGYHQRVTFSHDLATLVDVFGHSSQKQTLQYLCIQSDEIKSVYLNEL
jgi:integrase